MGALTWKAWLVVIAVALAVAIGTFLGLLQVQRVQQDRANLQAIIQLLNYNVAQGRLLQLPGPAPAPVPTADPAPAPSEAPKP